MKYGYGKAKLGFMDPVSQGKGAAGQSALHRFLPRRRHRVVNLRPHTLLEQMLPQGIPAWVANGKNVENVVECRIPMGKDQPIQLEFLEINIGQSSFFSVGFFQMRQFHPQEGGLEFIEAGIHP
jgi:hypothetical protein